MSDTDPQPVPEPVAGSARPARPARSARQALGTIVLGFEVIVVFLAALVIWGLAPPENSS